MLAITEGKKSTFTKPARRVYTEPDYNNPQSVSSALQQLKTDILSDFAQAFATNLDPSKVADVEPVKITLKNTPPHTSNRKSCRSLPFNILGEAEKMVKDLVHSGVIK